MHTTVFLCLLPLIASHSGHVRVVPVFKKDKLAGTIFKTEVGYEGSFCGTKTPGLVDIEMPVNNTTDTSECLVAKERHEHVVGGATLGSEEVKAGTKGTSHSHEREIGTRTPVRLQGCSRWSAGGAETILHHRHVGREQRTEDQDDYPGEALPVICCCIVILFVIMIILLLLLSTHYSGEIGDETNTGKATYLSVTKGGGNPPAQVPSLATTSEVVIPGPRERTTPGMTTPALVSTESQWLSTTSGSDTFGPGITTTQPLAPSTSTSSYPVPSPPTLPVTSSTLTTRVPVPQTTAAPPTAPPRTTPSTARTTPLTTSSTRRTTTRSTTRPTTTIATTTTTTSTTKTTTTTTTSTTTTTTTTTSTTTTTTTTTTTSTTTSTTTRPPTTPPASTTPGYNFTPLPGKPQRNFTLICVFEYILRAQYIWPKIDQCTDYVYVGAFTYFDDTRVNHDTLEFTKKTLKSKGFDVYLGTDPKYWEYINGARRAVAQVKKYVYPHADWYIGIWGSTYLRLLVSFWEPLRIRDSLHAYLRQPVIGGSNLTSFDGFAIINTILRDGRGEHQAYLTFNYSIFRGRNNPILPPSWRYIHTAAVWPPGSISRVPEVLVKNMIGVADIVGLSTSNTTDEPNRLHQARDSPGFYWASPPNPIRPPSDKMCGMLDMLLEFPHWKTVLNRSNLCFSVTSSINYARDDTVPIDFIKELSRISDNVVRYTRLRFISRVNGTQQYPVEDNKMKYEFDNRTHTHFWKAHFYSGPLMSFFADDNADTLRYKMQELLNAYPGDRCVVFDDLGDDYHEGGFQYDAHTVEFKKYGLLNVVASSMVQRYGTAFPPQYY